MTEFTCSWCNYWNLVSTLTDFVQYNDCEDFSKVSICEAGQSFNMWSRTRLLCVIPCLLQVTKSCLVLFYLFLYIFNFMFSWFCFVDCYFYYCSVYLTFYNHVWEIPRIVYYCVWGIPRIVYYCVWVIPRIVYFCVFLFLYSKIIITFRHFLLTHRH
jgi:hypothetical protein